jgi:hypothetical protein
MACDTCAGGALHRWPPGVNAIAAWKWKVKRLDPVVLEHSAAAPASSLYVIDSDDPSVNRCPPWGVLHTQRIRLRWRPGRFVTRPCTAALARNAQRSLPVASPVTEQVRSNDDRAHERAARPSRFVSTCYTVGGRPSP